MKQKEYDEILMPFSGRVESIRNRKNTIIVFLIEYAEYFQIEGASDHYRKTLMFLLICLWEKKKVQFQIDIAGMKIRKIDNVDVDDLEDVLPYKNLYDEPLIPPWLSLRNR